MRRNFALAILFAGLGLSPSILAQANGLLAPTPHTASLFHMETWTGRQLLDSGPKMLHGTILPGATRQTAPWGQALHLDGISGEVQIDDPQQKLIPSKKPFTIEAWVRVDNTGGFFPKPILSHAATNNQSAMELRYMPFQAGWAFKFQNSMGLTMSIYQRFDVQVGSWHHLAVTWNGYKGRLFCDGRLLSSLNFTDYMPLDPNQPWRIGAGEGGTFFKGAVDEVHFATDALTPASFRTMHAIYGIGKPGYNNIAPTIHLTGGPPTTNAGYLKIEMANGFPNLPGILFVSPKPDLIVISGGLLLVSTTNMISAPFMLDGGLLGKFGTAKAKINLPQLTPSFLGTFLCFQALLADPLALDLFSLTPGLIIWFPY